METPTQISKKRNFVADGVFFAELNEMLTRELAEDGDSGLEVRVTPHAHRDHHPRHPHSECPRREGTVDPGVDFGGAEAIQVPRAPREVNNRNRGLCAIAQAESLPAVQAPRWACCPKSLSQQAGLVPDLCSKGMLWCSQVCNGERC